MAQAQYCSPMIATGSGNTLGYVEEACYGMVPPTPIVKVARRRSTSIGMTKETYASEEIRGDRMISSSRHGIKAIAGDIVTEISSGGHADFYEALLGGNWEQATGTIALTAATVAMNATTGLVTIAGLSADPALQKALDGDVLRITGTTDPFFDNNLFQIMSMNSTSFVLAPLKNPTVAPLAGPFASGTAKPQPRCRMGNVYRSFTFERAFNDIGSFIAYKGCRFNTAAVDLPATGIATTTFGVMGQDASPLSSTSIDGSASLILTEAVFGMLTGDAAAKTLTASRAGASFITAGVNVGDKLILDGGAGSNLQNRALRTVVKVTALVLTVAEAVRTGSTGGSDAVPTPWTLTRLGQSTYDEGAQNAVLVSASGVVAIFGLPVATVTAMSLNIDNQMGTTPVVGADVVTSVLWGNNCNVSGSLTVLFDRGGAGEAAYNAFQNETDNIRVSVALVSADGTRCVAFVMNRCKFNTGEIGDAVAEGLPVTVEFQALKPSQSNAYYGPSQIMIVDTEVPAPAPATFAAFAMMGGGDPEFLMDTPPVDGSFMALAMDTSVTESALVPPAPAPAPSASASKSAK
jgi:hypothetical protein